MNEMRFEESSEFSAGEFHEPIDTKGVFLLCVLKTVSALLLLSH
jgi:hypothetical protein